MNEAQIMDWVDQNQKADETQFISLIDQHQGTITKICSVYKKTGEERDSLFKEIVFQLWQPDAKCNDKEISNSRLYQIAFSTAIASNILNPSKPTAHKSSPQAFTDHKEQLTNAIQQLTDDDKAIFMLYLEDLSYPTIAEITGIAETVVGVKLNRIKKKIQQQVNISKEQYPIKSIWKNIQSAPKSESELRSMIAERTNPILCILNNNILYLLSKSMTKGYDIKRSLEDHLAKTRSFAKLSIFTRIIAASCLLMLAKYAITNTSVWYWTLALTILLFAAHIAFLSTAWTKRIRQMKFTIDHLRIQKEYGRRDI